MLSNIILRVWFIMDPQKNLVVKFGVFLTRKMQFLQIIFLEKFFPARGKNINQNEKSLGSFEIN